MVVVNSCREVRRQLLRGAAHEGDAIARAGAGGLVLVELLGRWLCVRVRARRTEQVALGKRVDGAGQSVCEQVG